MKTAPHILVCLQAALFLAATAHAQVYDIFPGEPVDQQTRAIQERVESVYESGDFERALLIYEKELAPIGDKYAQYMVGYMHLNAQGVPQDRAEALAWFRLAAERGEPLLEQMRDDLGAGLSAEEIAESDRMFVDLWRSMGDRALVMELIRRDMRILQAQTGTRIPGSPSSGPSLILRPSGESLGPNFYPELMSRLAARIAYLDSKVETNDAVLAAELRKIRAQEAAVKAELAAMQNR